MDFWSSHILFQQELTNYLFSCFVIRTCSIFLFSFDKSKTLLQKAMHHYHNGPLMPFEMCLVLCGSAPFSLLLQSGKKKRSELDCFSVCGNKKSSHYTPTNLIQQISPSLHICLCLSTKTKNDLEKKILFCAPQYVRQKGSHILEKKC